MHTEPRSLIDLGAFRKTLECDLVGTVPQLREQLGRIRGLDQRSEQRRRMWGLLAIGAPVVCVIGSVVADNNRSEGASIAFAAMALASFVLGLVMWLIARRTDFENRRYECADQVLGSLVIAPETAVHLKLVLSPLQTQRKRTSLRENTETFSDLWLLLETQSPSGLQVRLTRTSHASVTRTRKVAGNRRTTTTTTLFSFDDTAAYQFQPGAFPQTEQWGAQIAQHVHLPAGQSVSDVVNHGGTLSITARCNQKWDANPAHQSVDGSAALLGLACNVGQLLGQPPIADANRRAAMPTAAVLAPASRFGWRVAVALALVGLACPTALMISESAKRIDIGSDSSSKHHARRVEEKCAGSQAPDALPAFAKRCKQELRSLKMNAKSQRELRDEARVELWLFVAATIALLAAAIGFAIWHMRVLKRVGNT